jgi:hypothetical protein
MKNIRRLRAMSSLCRQQAAYNPAQSRRLLAEAEYWEHLADAEMCFHFKECNTTSFSEPGESNSNANGTRWETDVAAYVLSSGLATLRAEKE